MTHYTGASLQELSSDQPIGFGVPAEKIADEIIKRIGIDAAREVMQQIAVLLNKKVGALLKDDEDGEKDWNEMPIEMKEGKFGN
jgi:hypothetical protein